MLTCRDIAELVTDYVERRMPLTQRLRFQFHLSLCTHCRAPLASSAADEFCCHGCRHVHDLLQESGLGRYYTLRGERTISCGERTSSRYDGIVKVYPEMTGRPEVIRLHIATQYTERIAPTTNLMKRTGCGSPRSNSS